MPTQQLVSVCFWGFLVSVFHSAQVLTQSPGLPTALNQPDNYAATAGLPLYDQAAQVIVDSGIDNVTARAIQVAVDFERSNWATGSILDDPFYCLPENASSAAPGSILKIEQQTNVTKYTVAPNLAMSRFMYMSETFNGTAVPTTAFVLWPWMARRFDNISGIPVVAWAHGTSGQSIECAPSHIQNLWYQYAAPFTLALQGYAVIGVDYAGLGLNETASGQPITHQWGSGQAGANDISFAVEAAQRAWPSQLSPQFVVMGHSQGGGAAWASAQRQFQQPVPGYLGAVAASPVTDFSFFAQTPPSFIGSELAFIATTLTSIFPEFQLLDWLTPAGLQTNQLIHDLGGCNSVRAESFVTSGTTYIKPDWNETWYLDIFNKLVSLDGKPFAGPMLVTQGTADNTVFPQGTTAAVNVTCQMIPDADLEYTMFEGATHTPSLYAAQQLWLDWISDRFSGKPSAGKCTTSTYEPALNVNAYQANENYFLELPLYTYETA